MKNFFFLFFVFLTVYIFRHWFFLQPLGGHDFFHFWPERLREFYLTPYLWDSTAENGLGDNTIKTLWVDRYLQVVVHFFINELKLDWNLVQRIFWLWPYLILSLLSPYLFLKKILPDNAKNIFLPIGVLVFSFNTYVLMLISGGQINLAIAYAMAPLALGLFIEQLTDNSKQITVNIKYSVATGLVLAIQAFFDLRLAYVTMVAVGIYFFINELTSSRIKELTGSKKESIFKIFSSLIYVFIIPGLITVLLHGFWLLPQVLVHSAPLPPGYDNPDWLSFLSWAKFSDAISLLHPNWPENIFGKIYFMRPEFLGIPILAFSSLIFLKNSKHETRNTKQIINSKSKIQNNITMEQSNNRTILFFVLLGLLGAFLAKGVNPPFGAMYNWLFSYVPFFTLFRDPTKFYILVAISYAVLIPYGLFSLSTWIKSKITVNKFVWIPACAGMIFIVYWLFLLVPVFSGQVKGALTTTQIPKEYYVWQKFLSNDKDFSRVLWVPQADRYAYVTSIHPSVNADKLFNNTNLPEILQILEEKSMADKLQTLAVKYVAVSQDAEAEIFLTDRKYNPKLKKNVLESLDKLSYFKKLNEFSNNLVVYEVTGNVKGHFWIATDNSKQITDNRKEIQYKMGNPTRYEVQVQNAKKGNVLVFSERYDRGWKAMLTANSKQLTVNSEKYQLFNSFILPQKGNYSLEVYYEPQKYVVWGTGISLVSLALCMLLLLGLRVKKGTV